VLTIGDRHDPILTSGHDHLVCFWASNGYVRALSPADGRANSRADAGRHRGGGASNFERVCLDAERGMVAILEERCILIERDEYLGALGLRRWDAFYGDRHGIRDTAAPRFRWS